MDKTGIKKLKKRGRKSKFRKIYCKRIIDYFNIPPTKIVLEKIHYKNGGEKEKEIEVANELPTITGFAMSIGVDDTTVVRWTKKNQTFRTAYEKAKKMQEDIWFKNSLKGFYNPQFAIFAGKNIFGWKDESKVKTEVTFPKPLLSNLKDVHNNNSPKKADGTK
jgi:hypothetical protein